MKRLIFLTLLVSAGIQMQGQVRFGIKGGMNVSGFDMSSMQGVVIDFSNRFAFHAGGFAEIPVGDFFSIQPELLFSSKGARCKISEIYKFPAVTGYDEIQIMKKTYAPCYIELPVYMKAGFKVGSGKFIAGAGPYIAYGVGGKMKAEMKLTKPYLPDVTYEIGKKKIDVFEKNKLKIKDPTNPSYEYVILFDKAPLKRFDFGLAGFAGYELNWGFFVTVGFQKGLCNIDNFDDEGDKLKNKTFSLSVGYKL